MLRNLGRSNRQLVLLVDRAGRLSVQDIAGVVAKLTERVGELGLVGATVRAIGRSVD